MLRQLERVFGVLAGGLGIGCLIYAVFGPSYVYDSYRNGVATSGMESWLKAGIGPISALYLCAMAILFIAVPVLAMRHAGRPRVLSLTGLWAVAVLLVAGTVISAAGVGLLLAAGTLVALFTAIVATLASVSRSERVLGHPATR